MSREFDSGLRLGKGRVIEKQQQVSNGKPQYKSTPHRVEFLTVAGRGSVCGFDSYDGG